MEKFIGDAVMALFGAPVAHEDDPERAVRAALTIRDRIAQDDGLQVRIAVTTGEALVVAERPAGRGRGHGLRGRRQHGLAPAVGGADQRDPRRRDDLSRDRASRSSTAKPSRCRRRGRRSRLSVWEAVADRAGASASTSSRRGGADLVGRSEELDLLTDALARARRERASQLVTLVGVPGIGKSRLVFELSRVVDDDPELIYWRQGRSLPYGEGVTFWALSEMVKAHAGILETDAADDAEQKLRAAVAEVISDAVDVDWALGHSAARRSRRRRRRSGRPAGGGVRRVAEVLRGSRRATAARARLRGPPMGRRRPARLRRPPGRVGERRPAPVRLHRPARAARASPRLGRREAQRDDDLALSALRERDGEADRRADGALGAAGGAAVGAARARRRESALRGGVRPDGAGRGASGGGGAARSRCRASSPRGSTRSRPRRRTSSRTRPCWARSSGSARSREIAGLARWTVEERLHALERKEFVRREQHSSVAGETEYAFRHILVRDVAYGQIPRARRGRQAPGRGGVDRVARPPEEHAELLAHHYLEALEYAKATGQDAADLAERGRLALRDAGDRATELAAPRGGGALLRGARSSSGRRTTRTAPSSCCGRSRPPGRPAEATSSSARSRPATRLLAAGRNDLAAEAELLLTNIFWYQGDREPVLRPSRRSSSSSPRTCRLPNQGARPRPGLAVPHAGLRGRAGDRGRARSARDGRDARPRGRSRPRA